MRKVSMFVLAILAVMAFITIPLFAGDHASHSCANAEKACCKEKADCCKTADAQCCNEGKACCDDAKCCKAADGSSTCCKEKCCATKKAA